MAVEIVKVQLPLSTESRDHILVYAKGRKNMEQIPLSSHVAAQLGSDFKAFFNATWSSATGWDIHARVDHQDW